MAADRA
ncbi:hypothetical protein D030_1273A, partial [Vibrio parahaemolyticus AQ3810]